MSRTTKWRVALAACALVVIGVSIIVWSSLEPVQDGKPVTYWISQLATSRSGSEAALDKLGADKTLPYLLRTIAGEEQRSAWQQLYTRYYIKLPTFARQPLPVPPPVQSRDKTEFIQSRAGYYLARLAGKDSSCAGVAVPRLARLLEHTNAATRFSAGLALGGFGSNAAPAVPVIEALLNHNHEKSHDVMLRVLENCGAQSMRTIPVLQKCSAMADGHLSIQCARTLWSLDRSQADFLRPVALKLSEAQDPGIRIESAPLLWRMDKDPGPVVPVLIGLLKQEKNPYHYRTVLLLKQIGPGARDAVPALTEMLKRTTRQEAFFLKAADEALQAIGL